MNWNIMKLFGNIVVNLENGEIYYDTNFNSVDIISYNAEADLLYLQN